MPTRPITFHSSLTVPESKPKLFESDELVDGIKLAAWSHRAPATVIDRYAKANVAGNTPARGEPDFSALSLDNSAYLENRAERHRRNCTVSRRRLQRRQTDVCKKVVDIYERFDAVE